MKLSLAVLAAVAAMSANADPIRTDPTSEITVFTDAGGAHIVTLIGTTALMLDYDDFKAVARVKEFGNIQRRVVGGSLGFGVGLKKFWVRTRFVDGRLICEKFAPRPRDAATLGALVKQLFAESCS